MFDHPSELAVGGVFRRFAAYVPVDEWAVFDGDWVLLVPICFDDGSVNLFIQMVDGDA